jgi:hypothetical protein
MCETKLDKHFLTVNIDLVIFTNYLCILYITEYCLINPQLKLFYSCVKPMMLYCCGIWVLDNWIKDNIYPDSCALLSNQSSVTIHSVYQSELSSPNECDSHDIADKIAECEYDHR